MSSVGGQARSWGVATDRSGNVIVVGSFRGAVDFGNGVVTSASGSFDAFIAKYTVQGTLIWVKHFGNTWDDGANAVTIDSQDNIVVTGYFGSTVDFGGTLLTATTPIFGTVSDIFVVKYASSGSLIWAKGFGGSNGDTGYGIAVDSSDSIFVAASLASADALFGSIILASVGGTDIALAKISATGNVVWAKRLGGTGTDVPHGIAVDKSGDVLVAGEYSGLVNFGGVAVTSAGSSDIVLAKYAGADGTYRWARSIGSGGTDIAYGVGTDPNNGNVIITGTFGGQIDFGGGHILTPGGIFLAAYDSSGNNIWALTPNLPTYGASSSDIGNGVSIDASGNIAMTGEVVSTVTFDGNLASYGSGGGVQNSFVSSYTSAGRYRWASRSTDTYSSSGNAVRMDAFGHVLSVGCFYGTVDFGTAAFTTQVNTVSPFASCYAN
jgi:hypothetical protein